MRAHEWLPEVNEGVGVGGKVIIKWQHEGGILGVMEMFLILTVSVSISWL